jgi:hypothetical protein
MAAPRAAPARNFRDPLAFILVQPARGFTTSIDVTQKL